MKQGCPNLETCYLAGNSNPGLSDGKHKEYLDKFCHGGEKAWSVCNRYLVKKAINFCPDFVLPDSNMTPDAVIEKFDSETI